MIYYLFFFILCFLLVLQYLLNNRYQTLILRFSLLLMFIFSSIRGDVGKDDQSYREIFERSDSFINYVQEPIFTIIVYLLKWLNLNSQFLFVFFAALNTFLLFKIVIKYAPINNIIILIMYFSHRYLHNDLNLIRQATASLLFMYSLSFFSKNKFVFYLINLIAIGIHLIAIVPFFLFLLYSVLNIPMNRNKQILLLVVTFFISYLFGLKFNINNLNIPAIDFISKVDTYISRDDFNVSINPLLDFVVIKCLFIIFIYYYFYNRMKNIDGVRTMFFFVVMTILILFIFQSNIAIAKRTSSILFVIEPFIIYLIFSHLPFRSRIFPIFALLIISLFQLYYNISISKILNDYNTFFI